MLVIYVIFCFICSFLIFALGWSTYGLSETGFKWLARATMFFPITIVLSPLIAAVGLMSAIVCGYKRLWSKAFPKPPQP